MILEILPSSLYDSPNIDVLLENNTSVIISKSLSNSLVNKKMYLSSVAILLVVKGEQVIKDYDGARLVVKESEMVLLPKDLYIVSDFVTHNNKFEATIFFMDNTLIEKFLFLHPVDSDKNKLTSTIVKAGASAQVCKYISSLNDVYKSNAKNQALLEVKVLEFLLLLVLDDSSKAFISCLSSPIKKRNIKTFMEANYLNNLKVNDYAALTGRSVSTFNREFKKMYGTTPNKWLVYKRLSKSHDLLKNTDLNVTDVSMEVGYENVSHFIDAYKKQYGVTPKYTSRKKND